MPRREIPRESLLTPLSAATWTYNCVSWAIGDPRLRWWPHDPTDLTRAGWYWPDGLPTSETVATFEALFTRLGFEPVVDSSLEAGYEKVALFVDDSGAPSHVSWQTVNGYWASKVGTQGTDCLHKRPEDANCEAYGTVSRYYRRPRTRWEMPTDPLKPGVIVNLVAPPGTVVVR